MLTEKANKYKEFYDLTCRASTRAFVEPPYCSAIIDLERQTYQHNPNNPKKLKK